MRLSLSRMKAVDSWESACSGMRNGWGNVPSPIAVAKTAAAAAGMALMARSLYLSFCGKKAAEVAPVGNPWRGVAARAVGLVVLPLLHRLITEGKPEITMPRVPEMPEIPTPSDVFFRWLGLQK